MWHVMDACGDHALCCHDLGIYARHNALRNEFATLCSELNLSVKIEEGPSNSSLRPADVLVGGLESQPVAVDFAVVREGSIQWSVWVLKWCPTQGAQFNN